MIIGHANKHFDLAFCLRGLGRDGDSLDDFVCVCVFVFLIYEYFTACWFLN